MISGRNKWITTAAVFMIMILLTAAGFGRMEGKAAGRQRITSAQDMKGKRLGGVKSAMTETSLNYLFGTVLGVTLKSTSSFDNLDEVLMALRSGRIDAAWVCDVTADRLERSYDDLAVIDSPNVTAEDRFSFGMATDTSEFGKALCNQIDMALDEMEDEGVLSKLKADYIDGDNEFTTADMLTGKRTYKAQNGEIRCGITGAVVPLEIIDESGNPSGFCVAMMDEIGQRIGCSVDFVKYDNDDVFAALLAGKIDLVFVTGNSFDTAGKTRPYIVTRGYLPMRAYKFVVLR